MITRSEESKLTSWFFEVDRRLLGAVLIMIAIGLLLTISAGSASAARIHEPWYHFLVKSLPFVGLGLVTLFASSMLDKKWVLRISWANVAVGMLLLIMTLVAPHTINGSDRWAHIMGMNIMPADIMKPGVIFVTAWFLTKMHEKYNGNIFFNRDAWQLNWMSWWSYLAFFVPAIIIIFQHPDVGTALLYFIVIGTMLFIAGLPLCLMPIGAVGVLGMLVVAFFTKQHVHDRVMTWLGQGTRDDRYQIEHSLDSIKNGGLFGRGDDAFVKQDLPDAHTDFIYAAIVEDGGAIVGCALLCLLLYVLKRLVTDATRARDPFVFYAAGGAAAVFGAQICFNMMSALHLFAPKGMTLPFISYGGSSLVGFCLLFGMLLAVIREDKWK